MKKLPGVERVKRVSGGAGSGSTRGVKDKCEDTLLLDEDSVKAMNVDVWTGLSLQESIDYAIGQLRVMRGHLATAKEGNIRGRLVANFDGMLAVGSSVSALLPTDVQYSVTGKMRYHEKDWPLADATTITWFASRSVCVEWCFHLQSNAFVQVATGPTYTPIVEDAGKRISLEIHNKGISSEFDAGCVQVSQELEDSVGVERTNDAQIHQILKKKQTLRMKIDTLSELPPEEQASNDVGIV